MNIWMFIVFLANGVFVYQGIIKKILTVKQVSYYEIYLVLFCFIVWIRSGFFDEFFIYLWIHLLTLVFIQSLNKPYIIKDNRRKR